MRRRVLTLAALVLLAGAGWSAAPAGEPPKRDRLSKRERNRLFNHIETCKSLQISLEQFAKEVDGMVALATGRDDAVDYIIEQGLRHEGEHARLASVEALARTGNQRALPALLELIEFDSNYNVRRHAARGIAGFGDPVALRQLFREIPDFDGSLQKRLLKNPDKTRKDLARAISRALDRFNSLIARMAANVDPDEQQKAKRELQRLTGDVNREAAGHWLKWWKARKGVPPKLDRKVRRTADRTTIMAFIELAVLIHRRESYPGLAVVLRNGETPVRMAAAAAIGRLCTEVTPQDKKEEDAWKNYRKRAAPDLRAALKDRSDWVRAAAARALATCTPKTAARDLLKLLKDDWAPEDKSAEHRAALARVRTAAIEGLSAEGVDLSKVPGVDLEVAEQLKDASGDRELRWKAVTALAKFGSTKRLPALARHAVRVRGLEFEHVLDAIGKVITRNEMSFPADENELGKDKDKKDSALAVGGVHRLHKLGRITLLQNLLRDTKSAPEEARMLAAALLAHKKWPPAVATLAAAAEKSPAEPEAALVACRAAARVCAPKAIDEFFKKPERERGKLSSRQALDAERRKAADSLLKLLADPGGKPAVAGAAARALRTVLPAGETEQKRRVLKALVDALGEFSLKSAYRDFGATLRQLTGEDYPDEAKLWTRWWEAQERIRMKKE
jgi:HEAT repeat protein